MLAKYRILAQDFLRSLPFTLIQYNLCCLMFKFYTCTHLYTMECHRFLVAIHRFHEQNTKGKRHCCWRFCQRKTQCEVENGNNCEHEIWGRAISLRTIFQGRIRAQNIKVFATTDLFCKLFRLQELFSLPLHIFPLLFI